MATQYVFGTLTGPGTLVDLGGIDNLVVGTSGNLGSTTGMAIYGTGSFQVVSVAGTVGANGTAIALGDNPASDINNAVRIAASGVVSSGINTGIFVAGSGSSVVNAGWISGNDGVAFSGPSGVPGATCINTGTIAAASIGVYNIGTGDCTLVNSGTITSGLYAFFGGSGASTVINRGLMQGDIFLGDANGIYDGRQGTVLGTVVGGLGNDRFVPGADVDVFDGGAGIDTLDLRMTSGLRVALGGEGTGVAQGDTYTNIEVILGSLSGRDVLIGNAANNRFFTYDGDDFANMGRGNDRFVGGMGNDTVWGGGGNDAFIFHDPGQGGDVINDFSNVAGNNDVFWISAAGFGGGLTAGALAGSQLQVRADNLAQDVDDRFIYRTTDNTLWYDANGNAAGGLTMLADLQAGATISAADIVLF